MDFPSAQIRAAVAHLLSQRRPPATLCPSEVARALSPSAWRPLMPEVRAAAVAMAKEGLLELRQGGRRVDPEDPIRGPIRLGHPRTDSLHQADDHPTTPDGRYFVVRGRLWRKANPDLPEEVRDALVRELMDARRALRGERPESERRAARERVDRAKHALGERGPVWWTDGAPDFNRMLVKNTPYQEWFARLPVGPG